MAVNYYSSGFKNYAVALYGALPEATVTQVAKELGISRHTLRSWVREHDKIDSRASGSPIESDTLLVKTLGEENKRLRAQVAGLTQERDLLRNTTVYLAKNAQW